MSYDAFHAAIRRPELRELATHWHKARQGRKMPAWRHIDPTAIANALPIAWAWKYNSETRQFIGRLAGDAIEAIFEHSFRGVEMSEIFTPAELARIYEMKCRVVTEPCFCLGSGVLVLKSGSYGVEERVIMPLAEDGVTADGVIGASYFKAATAQAEIDAVTFFSL